MNEHFQMIISTLKKWESGGKRELPNGTEVICHVPHVAPEAWLHRVFFPLSEQEIEQYEKQFHIQFPIVYKEFLSLANGISIFGYLNLWGLRKSNKRTVVEVLQQPFDLLTHNSERTKGCPDTWLFFGSYFEDGTRVLFDLSEGIQTTKVFLCKRRSTEVLKQWDDFWIWLSDEVTRLSTLFDSEGKRINPNFSTLPPIQ